MSRTRIASELMRVGNPPRCQPGGPGGMTGVNTTVVPLVRTRHGPGGWMETTARSGRANEFAAPGGARNVSMFTTPPAVVMLVRAYPGRVGGPGGNATGSR